MAGMEAYFLGVIFGLVFYLARAEAQLKQRDLPGVWHWLFPLLWAVAGTMFVVVLALFFSPIFGGTA